MRHCLGGQREKSRNIRSDAAGPRGPGGRLGSCEAGEAKEEAIAGQYLAVQPFRLRFFRYAPWVRPYHLSLTLTHACNLACSYCYMGEHHAGRMSWATAERALELGFAAAKGARALDLGFFGGEPLLESEAMLRVARRAREMAGAFGVALRMQVTTNGTLLDDRLVAELKTLGIVATLSLDGTREAHEATRPRSGGQSSYDAVVRGLHALRDGGWLSDVVAVVAPANVGQLSASVRALRDMSVARIHLNPAFDAAFTDAQLDVWERELVAVAMAWAEAYRQGTPFGLPALENKIAAAVAGGLRPGDVCAVGRSSVAVAPSGFLYPCDRLVGEDRDARRRIGHLDRGLADLQLPARGPAAEECGPCAIRDRCGGHCACANIAETGAPDLPGPVQCWYEQVVARIADETGHALLAEQNVPFLAWAYGDVAARVGDPRRRLPQVRR